MLLKDSLCPNQFLKEPDPSFEWKVKVKSSYPLILKQKDVKYPELNLAYKLVKCIYKSDYY